ncbi:MAG: hypothetical protein WCJ35_20775 [Planctomycetota bacterium]
MRVFVNSFAALIALFAFGPGVTGVALGDDNRTIVENAGVAGAPALPPVPTPVSDRTFAPAPAPVPAPTLAPAPVLSPIPAEQVRDDVGNPGRTQTPGVGVTAGVAANQNGEQWRYRWHGNNWWYWTRENRWVYRNGNEWINYEPTVTAVPDARYSSQPVYGYYQSSPNGYYPGPYRYSTGYRGYYGYGPVYQGSYYGSGGYYGQPGISIGLGFGRGLRVRF